MPLCPQCRTENPQGQKFCGECGVRLPVSCPACGSRNPSTGKFCGACGARLTADSAAPAAGAVEAASAFSRAREALFASPVAYTPKHLAEKILTTRSAVEGERKQITVMFTDVSGFTAMSERLDPEEVHAIMDHAFEIILAAVHRYEGTINQFLGDGVMALFGAPIAHEDHAHRALCAALAIQEGLAPLREDVRRAHGREFRIRIGINTGLVVVGAIGHDLRMDYTAVGDTTNLAARLLNLAEPGQIVASRHTQHLRELHKKYPFYTMEKIPANTYKGQEHEVTTPAVMAMMVARRDLPEDLVYNFTRAIFDNLPQFHSAHAAAKSLMLPTALNGMPIPLHPGAEKFYKEKVVAR